MLELTIGTNLKRIKVIISGSTTVGAALEDNDIDYSTAQLYLNGATINPGDTSKTFSELGINDKAVLIAVTKVDNAR